MINNLLHENIKSGATSSSIPSLIATCAPDGLLEWDSDTGGRGGGGGRTQHILRPGSADLVLIQRPKK